MAIYIVPSSHFGQINFTTQDRDYLSTLDVVWSNKYEDEKIDPTTAKETEFEFYKGSPPQWLNIYWAEKENSPFVKRDMYQDLINKINETKSKRCSIGHVNIFHNPGSGGSTLAMQVLWDLRKQFRCAKLLDSTSSKREIVQQVLHLFKAGGSENQNTVLLLLDNSDTSEDTSFLKSLEQNLYDEIKRNNVTATIPVVIMLSCRRQKNLTERKGTLNLRSCLSLEEQGHFTRKLSDIKEKHGSRHTQMHAFHIMLRNYDESYVTEICSIVHPLKKTHRPRKQQLLAFLALINSYVPGSDLPHDLCEMFIQKKGNNLQGESLAQQMWPITDLLAIYRTKEGEVRNQEMRVRMVHPKVAQECLRLLTEAGVTRSDTTLNLMEDLCGENMPLDLLQTIKTLLKNRESTLQKQGTSLKKVPDRFSRLILDIKEEEGIALLKRALNKFKTDPFLPQVLARLFYIEKNDYKRAEHYANMAITRDEKNSFIRDTLGQVYKNWLKNWLKNITSNHSLPLPDPEVNVIKILQLGQKATDAFIAEEEVAMEEEAPEMQDHGMTSTSTLFNNRGIFGYMQVAKIIFDHLKPLHEEWLKVLTQEINPNPFLSTYASGRCQKYKSLITSLRNEVEKRFEFFESCLLFSKPSVDTDEPLYFWKDINECYRNFVTQKHNIKSALQILKESQASTFAGLLKVQHTDLELITEQWKKIYLQSPHDAQIIQNYIVLNVMLSQSNHPSAAPLKELQAMLHSLWEKQIHQRSPEFYLLVLLLFWPNEQEGSNSLDISECIQYMHVSFDRVYKKYLGSRYLRPLFFHGKGHGLQKFVQLDDTSTDLNKGYDVPNKLRRMRGEVRNSEVFAGEGSEKIKVAANQPASVYGQGKVSFYLALTIKGPVAYNILYE